jgi:L-ascorbate metabolism protein UlaG (beta-lactamase superfamily)
MTSRPIAFICTLGAILIASSLHGSALAQQARAAGPLLPLESTDPGCRVARLVSTGGPGPASPQTLAIRWAGYANYEIAYANQVLLLDAAFDRGSTFPPLGFAVSDVKRADAILIGHGHADHMSDAAAVAAQTGALVIGAPVTAEKLRTQSLDPKQIRAVTGRGGEEVTVGPIRIEPILGRHSMRDTKVTEPIYGAIEAVSPQLTEAQRAEQRVIGQRGVNDPRLAAEGTITFVLTFGNGFRVLFRDTAGDITEFERTAMARLGSVDVAINALSAGVLNSVVSQRAAEYVRVYQPRVFMPAHHDAPFNDIWRATEPVFQVLKDENPELVTISRGYREPVCFSTAS